MAYYDVSLLAQDNDFLQRARACVVTEGEPTPDWVNDHSWQLAASPGFGDKYAYALGIGTPFPGRDPAVISDLEILSAIQAIGIP